MAKRQVNCPYCNVIMKYKGTEKIQLGQSNVLFEHLGHWLSGAMTVCIYECPKCTKLEFFRSRRNKG